MIASAPSKFRCTHCRSAPDPMVIMLCQNSSMLRSQLQYRTSFLHELEKKQVSLLLMVNTLYTAECAFIAISFLMAWLPVQSALS